LNSDCKVSDPDMSDWMTEFQEVTGNVYGCNHEECKQYFPGDKEWKTIPEKKFGSKREYAAGTLLEDKWVVQGGKYHDDKWVNFDVETTEVWIPGSAGEWTEYPEFKSPMAVWDHCFLTLNNKLMQIGGRQSTVGCNDVNPSDRVECGFNGITRTECENKGCCWDDSIENVRWCFEKPTGTTSKCFLDGVEVASLTAPRRNHVCAVFQGQVWVAGGIRDGADNYGVEIYDPATNTWRDDGPQLPMDIDDTDWYPQIVEHSDQLYYIGGTKIDKIYRLSQTKDEWEGVADIKTGEKFAAIVMRKPC